MLCAKFNWIWPGGFGKEVQNVECVQTDAGKNELKTTPLGIVTLFDFCFVYIQRIKVSNLIYLHMYIACCKS